MAEQDLIPAARAVVDAFNASDWEGCKTAMNSDCVYDEVGTSRILRGAGEIIRCFQEWKQAMPDVRGTITSALVSGNTVVLEITWKGTHTGPTLTCSGWGRVVVLGNVIDHGSKGIEQGTFSYTETREGSILENATGKPPQILRWGDSITVLLN